MAVTYVSRVFGGVIILLPPPPITDTVSIIATARDGLATAIARDGKVAASARDGKIIGKGT